MVYLDSVFNDSSFKCKHPRESVLVDDQNKVTDTKQLANNIIALTHVRSNKIAETVGLRSTLSKAIAPDKTIQNRGFGTSDDFM